MRGGRPKGSGPEMLDQSLGLFYLKIVELDTEGHTDPEHEYVFAGQAPETYRDVVVRNS